MTLQRLSVAFYMLSVTIVILVIDPWLWFMIGNEPFRWAAEYVVFSPHRLGFALFWVALVSVTLLALERDWMSVSKVCDGPNTVHTGALVSCCPISTDILICPMLFSFRILSHGKFSTEWRSPCSHPASR